MKRKWTAIAMSLVTVASLSLTACGGGGSNAASGSSESSEADGKTTLKICWWGNQVRNDATQEAVNLYMEQNPDINIEVEFMDWTGYWDKLSTVAAGGNLPDIIQMDYAYLKRYQESNQLANLDEFIENGTIDTSKFQEGVVDSGSVDGSCYAISLGIQPPCMVYDKAIVEEAGVEIPEYPTWEELYDIGQTIYEKTGVSTCLDPSMNTMLLLARSYGGYIYDDLEEGDSKAVQKHMEYVEKFSQAEFCISPELWAEKDAANVDTKPIVDQTTWNDFPFACQMPTIATAAGRDMGMCMHPKASDATAEQNYLKPSMFFSIAETSEHKEEAAKFIDWFSNDVECNKILKGERGVPVNSEVAEAISADLDDNTKRVFEYTEEAGQMTSPIDPPEPTSASEISQLLETITEGIMYGEITAEDATDQFMSGAAEILQEAAE